MPATREGMGRNAAGHWSQTSRVYSAALLLIKKVMLGKLLNIPLLAHPLFKVEINGTLLGNIMRVKLDKIYKMISPVLRRKQTFNNYSYY